MAPRPPARDPIGSDDNEASDDDSDMKNEIEYEYGDLEAASEDADTSRQRRQ